MSYNGSGTFVINTAGQPVVSGTVISSTAFNALTADLATGLSTAITKDGQTTPTANIPMGNNKITGLAVGTAATDAANLSQVQSTTAKLVNSISGADTITGTMSPTLGAYATGQMFYFIAAGDNTGAVTLNIDSLGAKAVTRDGSVALAASDIKSGEVVVVVYDGTRFQVVSQLNSSGDARFANVSIASALNVGGVSTLTGAVNIAGAVSIASSMSVVGVFTATGSSTLNGGVVINEPGADADTRIEGDTDANLFFADASTDRIGIGTSSPSNKLTVSGNADVTGNLGINTTSPAARLEVNGAIRSNTNITGPLGYFFTSATNPASTGASGNGLNLGYDANGEVCWIQSNRNSVSETRQLLLNPNGGNVGIGTTGTGARLDVRDTASTTGSILNLSNTSSAAAGNIVPIRFFTGNTFGGLEQCAAIWGINPNAGTNNGGALVFATSANGTATTPSERARIASDGQFQVSSSLAGSNLLSFTNSSTTGYGISMAVNNDSSGTYRYFEGFSQSASAQRIAIYTNGDVKNTNGVFAAFSDVKLKKDIVDAGSQWNDIKALRVRKYKLKNDAEGAVQIGLIAQEVEQVSPGLVNESQDETRDEDGKIVLTGEVTKGVKYSILYMKAVKALQEAMSRIESLEAKVAALEAK